MVFQNYALYPHMTNYENMAYGLKIAKVPKGRDPAPRGQGRQILELSPAGAQAARCPAASASAWPWAAPSCASRVSLFDEPLSNLDAKLRARPASKSRSCTAGWASPACS